VAPGHFMNYGIPHFYCRCVAVFLAVLVFPVVSFGDAPITARGRNIGTNGIYIWFYGNPVPASTAPAYAVPGQIRSISGYYAPTTIYCVNSCVGGGNITNVVGTWGENNGTTMTVNVGDGCPDFQILCQLYWSIQNTDSVPHCYEVRKNGVSWGNSYVCLEPGGTASWQYDNIPCNETNQYSVFKVDDFILPDGTYVTNATALTNAGYEFDVITNATTTNAFGTNWGGGTTYYATNNLDTPPIVYSSTNLSDITGEGLGAIYDELVKANSWLAKIYGKEVELVLIGQAVTNRLALMDGRLTAATNLLVGVTNRLGGLQIIGAATTNLLGMVTNHLAEVNRIGYLTTNQLNELINIERGTTNYLGSILSQLTNGVGGSDSNLLVEIRDHVEGIETNVGWMADHSRAGSNEIANTISNLGSVYAITNGLVVDSSLTEIVESIPVWQEDDPGYPTAQGNWTVSIMGKTFDMRVDSYPLLSSLLDKTRLLIRWFCLFAYLWWLVGFTGDYVRSAWGLRPVAVPNMTILGTNAVGWTLARIFQVVFMLAMGLIPALLGVWWGSFGGLGTSNPLSTGGGGASWDLALGLANRVLPLGYIMLLLCSALVYRVLILQIYLLAGFMVGRCYSSIIGFLCIASFSAEAATWQIENNSGGVWWIYVAPVSGPVVGPWVVPAGRSVLRLPDGDQLHYGRYESAFSYAVRVPSNQVLRVVWDGSGEDQESVKIKGVGR